jgi:NAD(P)-dependent dehydrogenase (short-subunit alcohol dehydrogenase family)
MSCFNPFSLEDKTILVVGASSGIGREIAIECSKMGARMIVASRNVLKLREVVSEMEGNGHSIIRTDLTQKEDIENLVKNISNVDGILISSGIGLALPIQFCSRDKFDEVFNLNFFAYTELTRLMYKKKKINKGGSIVFISSLAAGFSIVVSNSIYGSAKAALNSFMKYAALEFSPRKIRVNTINPGMVRTPLTVAGSISDDDMKKDMNDNYPLRRYGEPKDIAPMAIYLMSEASSWITGQAFVIDGGRSLK